MSGFVALINLDGERVDEDLLKKLTRSMSFRGPDGQSVWSDCYVGLGHALLNTTNALQAPQQPCSLDGLSWITADARLDDRATLIKSLEAKGRARLESATDAQLILHAFSVWRENCLEHLFGDFTFSIWNQADRQLFCARDQLGVKPLYYARAGRHLLVSNTLACIRAHPLVSDELDESFVSDFLLWGLNQRQDATIFADTRRLPAAHLLTWTHRGLSLKRYWTLPADEQIRFKDPTDYANRFKELLRASVNDRLDTNHVGIHMSGGLDSATVAATAHALLKERFSFFELRAYTVVYESLMPDDERFYAGLVANELGIPIDYLTADNYGLFEWLERPESRTPEPIDNPLPAVRVARNDLIRRNCRVVLTGWDGDSILSARLPPYFRALLKARRFRRATAEAFYMITHAKRPLLGLLRGVRGIVEKVRDETKVPSFFNDAVAARLNANKPREQQHRGDTPPLRPEAHRALTSPMLAALLECHDGGFTHVPIEVRHPLLDLRLVRYCLAIPAVPWAVRKHLMREATCDMLPHAVRLRPKTTLAGDPVYLSLGRAGSFRVAPSDIASAIGKYVDVGTSLQVSGEEHPTVCWMKLRACGLNYWLQQLVREEVRDSRPCSGVETVGG